MDFHPCFACLPCLLCGKDFSHDYYLATNIYQLLSLPLLLLLLLLLLLALCS